MSMFGLVGQMQDAKRPKAAPAGDALRDPLGSDPLARKPVQMDAKAGAAPAPASSVQEVADEGISGGGAPLPHRDAIQSSFGHHDIGQVQSHTGGAAASSATEMGAEAYATGNHVAFGRSPSLHTAAHEAAHVVQQQAGVHLKSGVGESDDAYERHADAVADKVVAGESAESLLDGMSGGGSKRGVQRKTLGEMKGSLVADSAARKSNAAYNTLLGTMGEIAELEEKALSIGQWTTLETRIEQVLLTVDGARSSAGWSDSNETRQARNHALDTLKLDLQAKIVELNGKIAADTTEAAPEFTIGHGAKAGFEMEYCDVLVFDITKLPEYHRSMIVSGKAASGLEITKNFWETVQEKGGYAKREVLFAGPNNTWEGQADSTLSCSNLELVTKPMTEGEWLNVGDAAERDAAVLGRLTGAIKDARQGKPLMPKELEAGVLPQKSGVRLYKKGEAKEPQIQMTAAVDLPAEPAEGRPPWWLAGMNYAAFPSIKNVVGGMKSTSWGNQKNPKSGAFKNAGGANVLVKSPIPSILRTPTDAPRQDQKEAWVVGMATALGVDLGGSVTKNIVDMSKAKNPKNAGMHLKGADFTWRAYFEALITGQDLIAEWASTAFGTVDEPEDAGVGQIKDRTLGADKVIEEHRETKGITSKNYLEKGRSWARTGQVPGA